MGNFKSCFYNLAFETYPELRELKQHHQIKMITLIFNAVTGALRAHDDDISAFVLSTSYLNRIFGCSKTFHRLNRKVQMFEFENGFSTGKARKVRLEETGFEQIWYKLRVAAETTDYLRDSRGNRILTAPNSILSRDKSGRTRTLNNQLGSSMVPISRDQVYRMLNTLNNEEHEVINGRNSQLERISTESPAYQVAWIRRAQYKCLGILFNSSLKGLPNNHLLQQYQESRSGRLQGIGLHLQNIPREIKSACLSGSIDHDISSCHFVLLAEIARVHGYDANEIGNYVDNKAEAHASLLENYEIPASISKTALISLIYGAPLSASKRNSLYKLIGEKCEHFIKDPLVLSIHSDIGECKKRLLKNLTVSNGSIKNALGKYIPKTAQKKKIVAHLLQGYEALALNLAINLYGENILLLSHDGFVTPNELNLEELSAFFEEETELRISYTSTQL